MNAEFFVLAFTAALNPKLLAIDLLLVENRRARAMFLWLLVGGLTVGITIGLLDVLVFHLGAIQSQKTVSASVDLALGLLLLAVGALLATGRLHARRKEPVPAGGGPPRKPQNPPDKSQKEKKDGWAQLLAEPRFGLAMLVGAICGIPGASYLAGLHILITSKASTANQVIDGPHTRIRLRFNSRIDAKRSRITLIASDGRRLSLDIDKQASDDALSSDVKDLQRGTYVLRWQVLAYDGHITRGEIRFQVR